MVDPYQQFPVFGCNPQFFLSWFLICWIMLDLSVAVFSPYFAGRHGLLKPCHPTSAIIPALTPLHPEINGRVLSFKKQNKDRDRGTCLVRMCEGHSLAVFVECTCAFLDGMTFALRAG